MPDSASNEPVAQHQQLVIADLQKKLQLYEDAMSSVAAPPEADDEIDLIEGDALDRMGEHGRGWWQGRNVRTGEIGAFPASYVE